MVVSDVSGVFLVSVASWRGGEFVASRVRDLANREYPRSEK